MSETAEDGKLAVERVKAITGGDEITARMLNKNPITFEPTHTVWLQTNNRPSVSDTSEATWRRLLIVPFRAVIPEAEQDRQLERKLRDEQRGDDESRATFAGALRRLRLERAARQIVV